MDKREFDVVYMLPVVAMMLVFIKTAQYNIEIN